MEREVIKKVYREHNIYIDDVEVIKDYMDAYARNCKIVFDIDDIVRYKKKGYNDIVYNLIYLYLYFRYDCKDVHKMPNKIKKWYPDLTLDNEYAKINLHSTPRAY